MKRITFLVGGRMFFVKGRMFYAEERTSFGEERSRCAEKKPYFPDGIALTVRFLFLEGFAE